jgi:hypothetical protein
MGPIECGRCLLRCLLPPSSRAGVRDAAERGEVATELPAVLLALEATGGAAEHEAPLNGTGLQQKAAPAIQLAIAACSNCAQLQYRPWAMHQGWQLVGKRDQEA